MIGKYITYLDLYNTDEKGGILMKQASKRHVSRFLAVVMTTCSVLSNVTGIQVFAAAKTIDVWDFGGVAQSGSEYTNHITVDDLSTMGKDKLGTDGKFTADGEVAFDGLTLTVTKNDRIYGTGTNGIDVSTSGKATTAYSDGYTANGMYYCNGTGGDMRRFATVKGVNAGDAVSVYAGTSNGAATLTHFTGGSQDSVVEMSKDGGILNFIAEESADFKVWFDATGGKPVINRIVRYPAASVSGSIDLSSLPVSGFGVSFRNKVTGKDTIAEVNGLNYTVSLTPGYTYTATMTGATGYGFTNDTKSVEITAADIASGKTANLKVEEKATFTYKGKVTGFAAGYDTSKLEVVLTPDADSLAETVKANLDSSLGFSATLEPDVEYTVSLVGVNDYEITSGGSVNANKDLTQDITVAAKALYTAKGSFIDLGSAKVTALTFVNVADDYSYTADISGTSYTAKLRDGSYQAVATVDGYKTNTHVVVNGKDVTKDLLFVESPKSTPSVTYSKDVYVGVSGKSPNYATMTEAMAAVKAMNPTSEAQRITVHIAPGVYREQFSIDTPYLTFVKEGSGEVKLTWYYGIGYEYFSADTTGYYNPENAFDKYDKHNVQKWGTAVYVKKTATAFRAEGITFEASFNQYVTDEEIQDGVALNPPSDSSISFKRTLGADVTTKTATERATALSIEADNCEFKDCSFIGSQDTLYMGSDIDVYYKDCYVQGNTDYIFGSGDAVFDGCELCFGGYSDSATGGYVTAARANGTAGYNGYLFRSCTITNKEGMKYGAGCFGRPWDKDAGVFFVNTKLENADAITAAGWTKMSSANPEDAQFKEYNTTFAGTAVDVSGRTAGTVQSSGNVDPKTYFGDWTPVYYVDENGAPAFSGTPNLSTDGDVLLPQTGNTFKVVYDLGANSGTDATEIDWYLVKDGTDTLVKAASKADGGEIVLTNDMIGSKLKAVVTPMLYSGAKGTPVELITEKEITLGAGGVDNGRTSGKSVIFLAGDSTVKDYSTGAINNGTNRMEGSWGEFLPYFIDKDSKFEVMDYAQGGRSAWTFLDGTKEDGSDKYLDKIKEQITKGDYLFIQFGHNDSSASYKDRYVPIGTPDSNGKFPYTAPTNAVMGQGTDGTFCWYLQQYVDVAKNAGATPVLVTPVSRMYFNADGTIYSHHGSKDEYVIATKQVAEDNGVQCIDLYTISKNLYEEAWKVQGNETEPKRLFGYGEKTHHSKLGGFALAAIMADFIEEDGTYAFSKDIVKPASLVATDAEGNTEFMVWSDSKFEGYNINSATGVYDENLPSEYWTPYINGLIAELGDAASDVKYGDVNEDNKIDASDATFTLQYVLNRNAVKINEKAADVDGKNGIDAADSTHILQKALVSTYTFPIEAA